MDGKSALAFATLALLTTAAAGCIEAPAFLAETDGEVTGLHHRAAVDEAAASWAPGAALVSIFTLELAEAEEPFPADPTPGNAEAPMWVYAYVSPEGESRAFRVLSDGRIFTVNDTMGAEEYASSTEPIVAIALDSDDALAIARSDASFAKALDGANASLAEGVAQMDDRDGWYFTAFSDDDSVIAIVDANTGELVSVTPFDFDWDFDWEWDGLEGNSYQPTEPVHLEESGSVDMQARRAEHPFEVTGMGGPARLEIIAEKSLPNDGLTWRIVDLAEEETVESGSTARFSPRSSDVSEAEFDLPPGEYVLVLSYSPATFVGAGAVHYTLTLDVGVLPADEEEG